MPGGKGARHQAAQAAMIGWVHDQHPMAHGGIDRLFPDVRAMHLLCARDIVLAEAFIAQD